MLIPQSVAAYVHDGGVRRAANEMIKFSDKKVLEGLDWSELALFYRAQLAVRQLECEWAMFGLAAWSEVWDGLLDQWTALSPDEQINGDYEAGLNLASLKDTDDDSLWFGRIFTNGPWTLYASLSAVPMVGMRIKIACESARIELAFEEIARNADAFGNWMSNVTVPLNKEQFEPGPLRDIARIAVEIANRYTSNKPAKG